MDSVSETELDRGKARHPIEVADESLAFRPVLIEDLTPTGAQLAAAAGAGAGAAVLQVLANGELDDIRPDQVVDLKHGEGRFIIAPSDRLYWFTLDGVRFDWPSKIISGGQLRKLGRVPPEKEISLERPWEGRRAIGPHDLVNLDAPGVEAFISHLRIWKLNVQGVIIKSSGPTILVKTAIEEAGFDPSQDWQIFLKVASEPKRPVALTDTIDLRTPGIEKLRLTPKHVHNGESPPRLRRAFALLDVDEQHLQALGLGWETVIENERRWLVIHDYPVPAGYTVRYTLLALEIPPTYPGAQIYGFYAYPPLALASGGAIDSTQMQGTVFGVEFHGWSRNRGAIQWNPATDNVSTQLTLVEAALAKEVGE